MLPSDCATSVGPGDDAKTAYLIDCGDGPDEDTSPLACDWWQPPPQPGSAGRRSRPASHRARGGALGGSVEAEALRDRLAELGYGP